MKYLHAPIVQETQSVENLDHLMVVCSGKGDNIAQLFVNKLLHTSFEQKPNVCEH
jgi:hypothetical protein